MLFYYLIFLLLIFLCTFKTQHNELTLFISAGVILFLIAAFRGDIDEDHYTYTMHYIENDFKDILIEPTYIIISNIVRNTFDNVEIVFGIYAFIAISIKLIAIYKLTEFRLLTLVVFFSCFFLLHEMTQMRASIAAGALLITVYLIKQRKFFFALLTLIAATLFHYSALMILTLFFFKPNKLNSIYYYLIPIAVCLAYLGIGLSKVMPYLNIPVEVVQMKLGNYQLLDENDINFFNVFLIFRVSFAYLLLWKLPILQKKNPYSIILVKAYVVAIFFFIVFSDIWGIGTRTSELLQIGEIILIPFLLYIFRNRWIGFGLVVLLSAGFLSYMLYQRALLKPYFG